MADSTSAATLTTDLTAEAKERIQRLIDESRSLSILFTGKTGVGKSSLANALVGREVSPEGETLNPETLDVFNYKADIAGVDVTIWDCPGLQDGISNEAEYLNKMATKCKELDLVLYCTRMDDTRIRDEDYEAIKTLTRAFGEGIWENAIFTLTFANQVKKIVRRRSHNPSVPVDQKEFFISRLTQWESKLKEALGKAGVSHDITSKMIVIPVGYQDNLHLPDRDNWLNDFWLTCLKRINKRATLALIKISADRLADSEGQENPEIKPFSLKNSDIKEALTGFGMIGSGFSAGALVGISAGPVGVAIGGAAGMMISTICFGIHAYTQAESKKLTK